MKEDYLWDKSGEVDADVERLENMLSSLRYKRPAEPLPLPVVKRPWLRFNSTLLAAAAAIALLLLVGGLWLKLHYPGSNKIASGPPPTTGPVNPTGGGSAVAGSKLPDKLVNPPAPETVVAPRIVEQPKRFVAARYSETKRSRELREEQYIRRGEIAKEQLIKALLITSEKLNVVQKKIQGTHESSPIS